MRKVQSRPRRPADTFQGSAGLLCLIGLALLTSGLTAANTTGADDFSGPVDTEKWGPDLGPSGFALFTQTDGALRYSEGFFGIPSDSGWVARPWILSPAPIDANWSATIDIVVPSALDGMLIRESQHIRAGILISPDPTKPELFQSFISFSLERRMANGDVSSFWTTETVDRGFPGEPRRTAAGGESATLTVRWDATARILSAEGPGAAGAIEEFANLKVGPEGDIFWDLVDSASFTLALLTSSSNIPLTFADGVSLDNFEFVCDGIGPGVPDPFTELPNLGGGWRDSPWFGFVNTSFFPWVFHLQHQWLFHVFRPAEQEIFFYDLTSAAWWFTSEQLYPNLFSFDRGRWIFYFVETATSREFVDLETGEFFSLP